MSDLTSAQVEEVFRLFDPDGDGLKLKDLGTVMRSLGLNVSNELLDEMLKEFSRKSQERISSGSVAPGESASNISFEEFLGCVERAKGAQRGADSIASGDLDGLRNGVNHFLGDNISQGRGKKPLNAKGRGVPAPAKIEKNSQIKVEDLIHVLRRLGDRLTEEETEDFLKDVRSNCQVRDGKVDFEEVRQWVLS